MSSDAERIAELVSERGGLMMRAGSLCGRMRAIIETMDLFLRALENSENDPGHFENFAYIRERLDAALNEYLDPEKPF